MLISNRVTRSNVRKEIIRRIKRCHFLRAIHHDGLWAEWKGRFAAAKQKTTPEEERAINLLKK